MSAAGVQCAEEDKLDDRRRCASRLEPRHGIGPSLAVAGLVAIALSVLLILNEVGKGPDDDLGIAMMLSGMYPDSGQCPFTNALLNNIIYGLNQTFSALNWFLVVERLSAVVACFALCWGLARYMPWAVALGAMGFASFLVYPLCTVASNFTVVGALAVMAGELLMVLFVLARRPSLAVTGVALTVFGFMWRASVFLLSLPFFVGAVVVAVCALRERRLIWDRSRVVRAVGVLGAVLALVGALSLYDLAVWRTPDLAQWKEYSNARSRLCDYPVKSYEDIADELESLDVSENDYWCMTHWITADPDYFTLERMEAVADVASLGTSGSILSAAKKEVKGLAGPRCAVLLWLGLLALCLGLRCGRRPLVIGAASLAVCFAACVYLKYTGRLPVRVEYPAWMFSLLPPLTSVLLASPCFSKAFVDGCSDANRGACLRWAVATGLGVLMLIGACGSLAFTYGPTVRVGAIDQFQRERVVTDSQELVARFQAGDTVQVWDPLAFPFIERELAYRELPSLAFMDRNVFAGGWTTASVSVARHNGAVGVANPLRSLAERPDVRFVAKRKDAVKRVRTYLREHYVPGIESQVVDEIPVVELKTNEAATLYVVSFVDPDAVY